MRTTKWMIVLAACLIIMACGQKSKPSLYSESDVEPVEEKVYIDEDDDNSYEEELRKDVEASRLDLPIDLGEGMVATQINLTEKNLSYIIECDEDYYDFDELRSNKTSLKESLEELIINGDEDFKSLIFLLVKTDRGLDYKYVGDQSEETVRIHLSSDELDSLLNE